LPEKHPDATLFFLIDAKGDIRYRVVNDPEYHHKIITIVIRHLIAGYLYNYTAHRQTHTRQSNETFLAISNSKTTTFTDFRDFTDGRHVRFQRRRKDSN
jgi:hypothetical protein